MIEIIKTNVFSSDGPHLKHQLLIDGIPISFRKASVNVSGGAYSISALDYETSCQIVRHSLSELFPLNYLSLNFKLEWLEVLDSISFVTNDGQNYRIFFEFGMIFAWKRPYSLEDYYKEFYKIVGAAANKEFEISLNETDRGLFE